MGEKLIRNESEQLTRLIFGSNSQFKRTKSLSERKENEIKALETKSEGVPMPERLKEQYPELFGGAE